MIGLALVAALFAPSSSAAAFVEQACVQTAGDPSRLSAFAQDFGLTAAPEAKPSWPEEPSDRVIAFRNETRSVQLEESAPKRERVTLPADPPWTAKLMPAYRSRATTAVRETAASAVCIVTVENGGPELIDELSSLQIGGSPLGDPTERSWNSVTRWTVGRGGVRDVQYSFDADGAEPHVTAGVIVINYVR